ncbi:MAG: peptidase Ste24p [Fluviicola sp.]|jgi:predicted Zn-dependent protease|uniref:M48 family metallopeptidase n=1 Tax=Fluviicola sp. TaxID=1917219 RepID=UPI002609EF80|nr:M48 family metallopeptidase [Fluviicola sp.]MDF3028746.1 peptidase Ste24p [Fluviicola sp.]
MFKTTFILTCLISITLSSGLSAQVKTDFDHYKTLASTGSIPEDFSMSTYEKVDRDVKIDRPELAVSLRKRFYTGIHSAIDGILQSEVCVFGDPLSLYVKDIAKNLLKDDRETYKELRFYTLKSNETNAFSTDQGIIFVTTGLISQVSSEAQLAYVLAHEIAHYKRKHVLERFKQKTVLKNANYYELSTYSKERELEADSDAIELYKNAGYEEALIEPTFDVLMYSYLPFDEVRIPETFFNSKAFYVPAFKFPKETFAITAEEDYNDSKSSHPNISKRKKQVLEVLEKGSGWKGTANILGAERFNEMRTIARFESVRNSILALDLTNALYSIFILEKEFPNSQYLTSMKAKTWLALAQTKSASVSKPFESKIHKEGEIASLHAMLKKMDKLELSSIALRQIYDIREVNSSDPEIQAIYDRMVETAANTKQFSLESFSKYDYHQAVQRNKTYNDSIAKIPADSLTKIETSKTESKYDKIKKKRSADGNIDAQVFDSTAYYLYGMTDIMSDSSFVRSFKSAHSKSLNTEEAKENKSKLIPAIPDLKTKSIALVEPDIEIAESSNKTIKVSESIKKNSTELILQEAAANGYNISTDNAPNSLNIEGINAFMYLKSALRQNEGYSKVNFFPIDYTELQNMSKKYSSDVIMIPLVFYIDNKKSNPMEIARPVLGTWYVPPMAFILLTGKLLDAQKTFINFIGVDLKNGHADSSGEYLISGKPSKILLGSKYYEIFKSTN